MPERIVDGTEIHDVHQDDPGDAPGDRGYTNRVFDARAQKFLVRQPGERVVVRRTPGLGGKLPLFGDVDDCGLARLRWLRTERAVLLENPAHRFGAAAILDGIRHAVADRARDHGADRRHVVGMHAFAKQSRIGGG